MREHDGALGNGIDVHVQLERTEPLEKLRLEQLPAARRIERCQVARIVICEGERVHEIGQLRHAARHSEAPFERIVPKVHMEAGLHLALPALPVPLRHRELVQIREHLVINLHGSQASP